MSSGATTPQSPSPRDIHHFMMNAWNRRDFAAIRSVCHPEYAYRGGDGKLSAVGPEVAEQIARMYAAAFPDGTMEIVRVFVDGDITIAEYVARGTHQGELMGIPATGKSVVIHVCNIVELRDGKIYREHEYMDMHSLLVQLGVAESRG